MPFVKGGVIPGNRFQKGESGNPKGKEIGKKNGATVVTEILELVSVMPDGAYEKIKQLFPDIEKRMSGEKMLLLVQLAQAITKNDTSAADFLMKRRYGQPKYDVEIDNKSVITIEIK